MKPNTNGTAKPDLIKVADSNEIKIKTRTYTDKDGKLFTITEEEFAIVVWIFEYLRKSRDEKNAQADGVEPESCAQDEQTTLKERAG